ncbi:hypothetical protein LIER_14081 [Lithospermum erythrorhizon]|uniref:RNase H type-1 domain-containing protein n=1 Tax=Lithospermum erythrorhizon TaxID=34254 RepID=A0AAV3Q0A6_LITER
MKSLESYKDVQKLIGCLAALSRFISKSGERNLSFFKNLRRASKETFHWDEEYLGSPKLLSRPEPKEELQVYLAVPEGAITSLLVRETEGTQKPIYYVSHVLHGDEENYPTINKFAFAVLISARKLKVYFEAHPIKVIKDQPLKRILASPAISGRLTTWAIELSEFDISYVPRASIKAQALADFIVECTARPPQRIRGLKESRLEPMPAWTVYVDGAKNSKGSGAGLLIRGPNGIEMEYVIRLSFKATNYEAEYEALVAGLELVQSLGVRQILEGSSHGHSIEAQRIQQRSLRFCMRESCIENPSRDHYCYAYPNRISKRMKGRQFCVGDLVPFTQTHSPRSEKPPTPGQPNHLDGVPLSSGKGGQSLKKARGEGHYSPAM